jgi:glycosyltransferase involved in cell wall biosynthesis
LGIEKSVTFLGAQPHQVVMSEMQLGRCFVQHSVVASDGDSEGTPVAILEAGASGLPVISTHHAGIPDVVVQGETGLLVEEYDVDAMASEMLRIAVDPELAGCLGRMARKHVQENFSMERRIGRLWSIIQRSINRSSLDSATLSCADEADLHPNSRTAGSSK